MFLDSRNFSVLSDVVSSLIAPIKFVPLSHLIWRTDPLRAKKERRPRMDESVVMSGNSSICMALLTIHVHSSPYVLISLRPCFTKRGPKQSHPLYVKGVR